MSTPLPPLLTIVVPTYNERDNVAAVVAGVRGALDGERWELIFVDDDSPDGTLAEIDRHAAADARVRRLRRVGRRGLASACIEGVLASSAEYVAIMDGDAQHDPALLKRMLDTARAQGSDVVIASRADTAGHEAFRGPLRRWLTRFGNSMALLLVGAQARDPLSGFFLVRRAVFERRADALYGQGFKILLDLLSAAREPLRVAEVPAALRPRAAGESKMGFGVGFDAALLVIYHLAGRLVSPRFALYCAVGLSGVVVHLVVLQATFDWLDQRFLPAQALATFVAMTSNFFLNNAITFGDRRLRGRAIVRGLFSFYLACSAGAVVSVAVGDLLFGLRLPLWVAGAGGALTAAIWNFSLNAALTWRTR
jgi:dolichol-phosphate mannosyltransferase